MKHNELTSLLESYKDITSITLTPEAYNEYIKSLRDYNDSDLLTSALNFKVSESGRLVNILKDKRGVYDTETNIK